MKAITCQISKSSLKSRPKPSEIHKDDCLKGDIAKSEALKIKKPHLQIQDSLI